jgi:hypothetical protein
MRIWFKQGAFAVKRMLEVTAIGLCGSRLCSVGYMVLATTAGERGNNSGNKYLA